MSWIFLPAAIILEVAGTVCLKLSQGFTQLLPSVLIFDFYGLSFSAVALALKGIELSVSYAIWSALGTALIATISVLWFRERVTLLKVISLALVIMGVIGLNLSGEGKGKHQMEVPNRPLLSRGDLPKRVIYLPGYIPDDELERITSIIRAIECPYQRAALLIALWSGARRDEICRLSIDCLDSYPDGTPRLRIPAGKTNRERMVPLHEEAAEVIRRLLLLRPRVGRGRRDPHTGVETHYLFMHYGKRFSAPYLFEQPLQKACKISGLVTADGKAKVTAHRFRHTVATQLARKGAKLNTIMWVLGHESANHTMVYLHISDQEVLDDYSAALRTELKPGMAVAGPFAEILRTSKLSSTDVEWLKARFIKTELELGECLRLPEEGPCECDLYLYCSRFITSPERAPRLRDRLRVEVTLAEEAQTAGNEKEAERHRHYALRFERYLLDMGESLEPLEPLQPLDGN